MKFATQTLLAAIALGCQPATPPPTREVVQLTGTPYERGRQHGERLSSKVRSLYTTLLATAILPNLNREQPDLAQAFAEYRKERYAQGRFSFELLLDSARSLERSIPRAYQEEMRGIADGAGMPYEQVLVLNTFLDPVLAIRAVAAIARASASPTLERVEVLGLEQDGVDNDGDGVADEQGEADFPYQPLPHATRVELPAGARFRFTLEDPDGIDPATVRVTLGDRVFGPGDPELATRTPPEDPTRLEATLTPPAPLPAGAFAVVVQAGDRSLVTAPPPAHARFMRDERLTFTTAGTGRRPEEVENRGQLPSRPPAFAFAARGSSTVDGGPLLAHSFALLDGNTAHKHTALFVHHPDRGEPFAVVGWAGIVWGTSGMNRHGLAGGCNPSDTLDNSVVRGLISQLGDLDNAKLLASGQPIGVFLRLALERDASVAAAVARARDTSHAFGWSCLFADRSGDVRALELDSNFTKDGGAFEYRPEGVDDLRVGSHFRANAEDISPMVLGGQKVQPQRGWSTFYFRSLDAWSLVGEELARRRGGIDADAAVELLRTKSLVDPTDSMNAVVFEPAAGRLRAAMGALPASDAEFEAFSFEEAP